MQRVVRFGISLEPDLLEKFDKIINEKGYKSRSEAIRDIIREKIMERKLSKSKDKIMGVISMVYDHELTGTTHNLLHIQHSHHSRVRSTLHIHLDEKNCLEVLIVEGRREDIVKLSDSLQALRGVKYSKLDMVVSPD